MLNQSINVEWDVKLFSSEQIDVGSLQPLSFVNHFVHAIDIVQVTVQGPNLRKILRQTLDNPQIMTKLKIILRLTYKNANLHNMLR